MPYPIGLNHQVNKILDEFYARQKALLEPDAEADPFDKDPPRNIRSFSQNTTDERGDSLQTARNIGDLIRGKTRLNIISALTSNDLVDFYKFKAASAGKLSISITTDSSIGIQLLKRDGTVIADSAATFGEKADNFTKLGTGQLSVEAGNYYVKITRAVGEDRATKPNYAIQLAMSRYFESDYDTIESPAANITASLGSVQAQNGSAINSVLNAFGLGGLFDISV